MPFNSPLTAGEITQVRKTTQAFEHYVLVTPNDIVWQAQVNETISDQVYAQFDWTTTLQGAYTNVIEGQVLLITTSASDFSAPIVRGRVRKVPDATDVFINETGTNIDTTMYVTVIDDFDIVERLPKLTTSNEQLKDWDISYQGLPPLVAGLQSAYVDFSTDATVTFEFRPTAVAIESGASISTWSWVVDDGSFVNGTSSSDQEVDVQFPGAATNEHRWCHLTVTDDNGVATTFHFQVFTVNKNSSAVVLLDSGQLNISGVLEDGWNTTISAFDGVGLSELLDLTRVVIAGIATYDVDGTPDQTVINTNILMIGRLRNEISNTETAEQASIVINTDFTVEGFATQLARLPFMPQQVLDDDSPILWGDITDPDPVRVIVYILAYHSTYPNLSSITIQDLSAFIIGDTNLSDTNVLENVEQIADVVKALPAYAPSGETTIQRNANYLSTTDRNALDTIFTFDSQDYTGIPSLSLEYGVQFGQAITAAIVYDSTNNEVGQNWVARAPAESAGSAIEQTQMVNQVLTADSTEANARSEIRQRIANDLAFVNPKADLSMGLMDGFRWMVPTVHQWWKHTITSTLTARERTYTSSDRWWLRSVNYNANNDDNTSALTAQFIEETESTNAGILPSLVPDVNALQLSFPPLSPGDFFIDDPLVSHPIDTPEFDYPFSAQNSLEPTPPGNNGDVGIGADVLNVPFFNNNIVNTKRITTFGESYLVRVEGEAVITRGGNTWPQFFNFREGFEGWSIVPGLKDDPTFVSGQGIKSGVGGVGSGRWAQTKITIAMASTTITMGQFRYSTTLNSDVEWTDTTSRITLSGDYFTYLPVGLNKEISDAIGRTATSLSLDVFHSYNDNNGLDPTAEAYIHDCTVWGTGNNPFGGGPLRGDAFYTGYDEDPQDIRLYSSGLGLLINGVTPSGIPPYNPSHVYELVVSGTNAKMFFQYLDSDYSDNNNNKIKVTIIGDNMGITP